MSSEADSEGIVIGIVAARHTLVGVTAEGELKASAAVRRRRCVCDAGVERPRTEEERSGCRRLAASVLVAVASRECSAEQTTSATAATAASLIVVVSGREETLRVIMDAT